MGRFSAVEIIAKKQAGKRLSADEISWFIDGLTRGDIPDYQVSALLMAIYFKGMNEAEIRDLSVAMISSGKRLSLSTIPDYKVDKHSTGGVGDKISLVVGPLVASLGVYVPMISGRALGHTGGTLDKLESIPGLRTDFTADQFERIVRQVGIAIIGQTEEVAPADKRLYAIRDVTSTVACKPLIVSSILSKKVASGVNGVVFDIKCGKGAFLRRHADTLDLAKALIKIGKSLGIDASCVLTSMDDPIGYCVGNSIEVIESIDVLKGKIIDDVLDVVFATGAEMLILAGRARGYKEANRLLRESLFSGRALETFRKLVVAQGGEERVIGEPEKVLHLAPCRAELKAKQSGYIGPIDALEVGRIATLLGAGRAKKEDRVDHSVGIRFLKKRGEPVRRGEPICIIYSRDEESGIYASQRLLDSIIISTRSLRRRSVVLGKLVGKKLRRVPICWRQN